MMLSYLVKVSYFAYCDVCQNITYMYEELHFLLASPGELVKPKIAVFLSSVIVIIFVIAEVLFHSVIKGCRQDKSKGYTNGQQQ